MEHNLNWYEVISRYMLMMLFVIIGGVTQSLWVMLIGLPLFITGLLGWCPIYYFLGINHAIKKG